MATDGRFKIDTEGYSLVWPFHLFVKEKTRFLPPFYRWKKLGSFTTREEAKSFYEKIKDLPEYLP